MIPVLYEDNSFLVCIKSPGLLSQDGPGSCLPALLREQCHCDIYPIPVSYTHLDVYKRQVEESILFLERKRTKKNFYAKLRFAIAAVYVRSKPKDKQNVVLREKFSFGTFLFQKKSIDTRKESLMSNLLVKNIGTLATPIGKRARGGAAQGEIQILHGAWVTVEDGVIIGTGTGDAPVPRGARTIDAGGRLVTPGLVDAHTHLIFGGWRQNELALKLRGVPYLDILAQGLSLIHI